MVWDLHFPQAHGANTVNQLEQYLERARAEGKPVLIDFYADWCAACKELDRETYAASEVLEESGRFLTIKVDGTNEDGPIPELYERFGIQGLPTVAFISSQGEILKDPRVTGFLAPEKFLEVMAKVR
jgi:thiol:disulfide interchange protein DsbD